MPVKVKQVEGSTLVAMGNSSHWVTMDTIPKFLGSDGASRPMELILMGLGGCTAMDVVTILDKMRVQYDNFEILIFDERADEHPKVYTRIHLRYIFRGQELPQEKIEKAVRLSQEKYCSVSAMLKQVAELSYEVLLNPSDEEIKQSPF